MVSNDQRRLNKLEQILTKLKRGKNVQNRMLQTWLTAEEYSQFIETWDEQKRRRVELKQKPEMIRAYEAKLKQAIFQYNKADAYSSRGNTHAAKKLFSASERSCERAVEILQELKAEDLGICVWFDRALDFEPDSLITASPVPMPRVITSRSLDNQRLGTALTKKIDIKISIVEAAISTIKHPQTQDATGRQRAELEAFLKLD